MDRTHSNDPIGQIIPVAWWYLKAHNITHVDHLENCSSLTLKGKGNHSTWVSASWEQQICILHCHNYSHLAFSC